LLRLLDIEETDRVPTAAVDCKVQPRLLINPAFVDAHADTPEKLLMLVMHELHHVLLGHTTLFPRNTPAQNFVFDAVINGLICRMFADVPYTAFLTGYYRDDAFPECLLRPPAGWPQAGFATVPGLDVLQEPLRSRALEVHAALYSDAGASYHEVYEVLPCLMEKAGVGQRQDIPLLGGHAQGGHESSDEDPQGHGDLQRVSPLLFDLVRDLVEQWPQPPDPIRGRSLADVLKTATVVPQTHPSRRSVLRSLIRKVAGHHGQGRAMRMAADTVAFSGPVPSLTRRSMVLHALGATPLMHEGHLAWRRRCPVGERVHVYLDVSGSMDRLLGPLYGAALDCRDMLHPKVHLFSTKVADISLDELRAGKCVTTGGTSIDVVAEHMASHAVRRAVLITDGWVGTPRGQHHQILKAAHLAVAYLGEQPNTTDLAAVADHCAFLNPGDFS
jgi:hypothetical protein